MAEKTADIRILTSELVKRLNEDTRRIRSLEQRMERFELGLSSLEETFETQMQDLKKNLDTIAEGVKNISEKLLVFETDISKVHKELERRATKQEVKELESYISLMSPITAKFVTKAELEEALAEKAGKKI